VRAPLRQERDEGIMSATEPQRLALHAAARVTLGAEEGDTLMALIPPANTEIATRQDVERSAAELRSEMHAGFAQLRSEMHAGYAELRSEMHAGFAQLRIEFKEQLHRSQLWTIGILLTAMFALQSASVALTTLLLR
jgi:hypothetical protein